MGCAPGKDAVMAEIIQQKVKFCPLIYDLSVSK